MSGIIITIIVGCVILTIIALLPVRCPKCNKKCKEEYHGDIFYAGNLYFKCPEHGDIDQLTKEHDK